MECLGFMVWGLEIEGSGFKASEGWVRAGFVLGLVGA